MTLAVEDGEAPADIRDILVSGHVLTIGIAQKKIDKAKEAEVIEVD